METNTNQEVAIKITYNNLVLKRMILKDGVEVVLKRIINSIKSDIKFLDKQKIEDIGKK
jgi:hypothetical protein